MRASLRASTGPGRTSAVHSGRRLGRSSTASRDAAWHARSSRPESPRPRLDSRSPLSLARRRWPSVRRRGRCRAPRRRARPTTRSPGAAGGGPRLPASPARSSAGFDPPRQTWLAGAPGRRPRPARGRPSVRGRRRGRRLRRAARRPGRRLRRRTPTGSARPTNRSTPRRVGDRSSRRRPRVLEPLTATAADLPALGRARGETTSTRVAVDAAADLLPDGPAAAPVPMRWQGRRPTSTSRSARPWGTGRRTGAEPRPLR